MKDITSPEQGSYIFFKLLLRPYIFYFKPKLVLILGIKMFTQYGRALALKLHQGLSNSARMLCYISYWVFKDAALQHNYYCCLFRNGYIPQGNIII